MYIWASSEKQKNFSERQLIETEFVYCQECIFLDK